MSGKMNWDRVRKEVLARLHGSEWVNPFADSHGPGSFERNHVRRPKRKKRKLQDRKSIAPGVRMAGCSCGKLIGFTGQHKKRCPLCQPMAPIASPRRVVMTPSAAFHWSGSSPQSWHL
jgi:hypothetical protein